MLLGIFCGGPFGRSTIAAEVLETESSQPAEEKDPTVSESETLAAGRRTGWRLRRAATVRCAPLSPTARLEGPGRVDRRRIGSQFSLGLKVPLRC